MKFSDMIIENSVINLDELANKLKMDKDDLKRKIKSKIHKKYPIVYFDGTVITQVEKLSEKMINEIDDIITLEQPDKAAKKQMKESTAIKEKILTKDDELLTEEEKKLRLALKEIENL